MPQEQRWLSNARPSTFQVGLAKSDMVKQTVKQVGHGGKKYISLRNHKFKRDFVNFTEVGVYRNQHLSSLQGRIRKQLYASAKANEC